VLYWGSYRDMSIGDPAQQTAVDNIFYFSPVHAFVIVPFDKLQTVPVAMNLGIIGHEYAHRVFNTKALAGAALSPVLGWEGLSLNLVKSIDEGFADFHGYGVTRHTKDGPGGITKFMAESFDGLDPKIAAARDFSNNDLCLTVDLRNALMSQSSATFIGQGNQYKIGTLFAASLYQAANKSGKVELMQAALVKAYDDESSMTPGFKQFFNLNIESPDKVTLEAIVAVILNHITDTELKKQTCSELWTRLDLHPLDMQFVPPGCPTTALRGTTCMTLPPP
jgi:hypothetical protein